MRAAATANQTNSCALYMRLSREDDNGSESTSIATQRKILRDYVREHGFRIFDEYIDDGYTGTNLDRPAFNRMLRDIEAGRIDTVLTKDVSRLGRNNGRVSTLLDEYFPLHRVRYISVSEQHDSAESTAASSIVMPVHNFMNEFYARDISQKIHAAFDIKRKEGEFIGAFAPYGYRKDPSNKNRLLVDADAAAVVRRIFALAKEGYSPSQIAGVLNRESVPTPLQYRYAVHRHLDIRRLDGAEVWHTATVSRLLRNETYLGRTVQGKTYKPSFKVREVKSQPRAEWIVVDDTHQPIIDEETWAVVRKRMQSRAQKRDKGFVNIFSGLAKCADCGRNMSTVGTRKKGAAANLSCGGYKLGGTAVCTNHTIDYDLLYQVVLQTLRRQIRLSQEEKQQLLTAMLQEADKADISETMRLQKKLAAVNGKLAQLFDDKYAGLIDVAQFETLHQRYCKEKTYLTEKLYIAEQNRHAKDNSTALSESCQKYQALIAEYDDLQVLTPELLFGLIDRIDVHQGTYIDGVKHQQLDIWFKFRCDTEAIKLHI